MSGHSKWHSIKHKKGAADAARGKVFTRHAKLIEIAAREGRGGDADKNPGLRTAIDNAKAENVPNANIDRAIKKGTGELKGAAQTVEVIYEAYGPKGTAFMIECLTDNKNRAVSNVKTILGKQGGRFADSGSVSWMFKQKGVIIARGSTNEELELALIDAGAEDIDTTDNVIDITTSREGWNKVRDAAKNAGCEIESAGLKYIASQSVDISDANIAKKIFTLISALEEHEDVSEVHTNADISAEVAAAL